MTEPFQLSSDPPPSKRTLRGRLERKTLGFQRALVAYRSVREIKRAIRRGGRLAPSRLEEIGVPDLATLLLYLRDDLRRLLSHYGESSIRQLFQRHYGRTPPCFQFHHVVSPRDFDMEREADRKGCCHFSNLRLVTAEENLAFEARKRREKGNHSQLWLFSNLRHDS